MRTLTILPLAHQDLDDAYKWYQRQRTGLGIEFLAAVYDKLVEARERPTSFPEVSDHPPHRRAIVDRFNYKVVYLASDDEITVVAVYHPSRDPAVWHDRIE